MGIIYNSKNIQDVDVKSLHLKKAKCTHNNIKEGILYYCDIERRLFIFNNDVMGNKCHDFDNVILQYSPYTLSYELVINVTSKPYMSSSGYEFELLESEMFQTY